MTPGPALLVAALVAAAAADAPPSPAQPAPAKSAAPEKKGRPTLPPRASLPTVTGRVAEVDHRNHRLRLVTAGGVEVVLAFDRNTFVFGPAGAVTPLQIAPGATVRIGRDGDARAAWVELGAVPSPPKAAP